jgi:hypothetical protein
MEEFFHLLSKQDYYYGIDENKQMIYLAIVRAISFDK